MPHTIHLFYQTNIEEYESELRKQKNTSSKLSIIRGITFLTIIVAGIILYRINTFAFIVCEVVLLTIFSYLIRSYSVLNKKITHTEELLKINKNEMEALQGNISAFDAGNEFIDYSHPYSYDLDIFGEGSVFQYFNRSCSTIGKNKLADFFSIQNNTKQQIADYQQAVNELAAKTHWRQNFQAVGNINLETKNQTWFALHQQKRQVPKSEEIIAWLTAEPELKMNIVYRIFIYAIPLFTLVSFGLFTSQLLSEKPFVFLFVFNLFFIAFHIKKINKIHNEAGEKNKILQKYAALLQVIENENFKSGFLSNQKTKLKTDNKTAGVNLKTFVNQIKALDNRLNMIFAILSNGLLLWDLHFALKISDWKQKFKAEAPHWFEVIAQFDALNSLSNFAFNNPDFVYPEVSEEDFLLDFEEAGHILIDSKMRVNNNFRISGKGSMTIVTGANMAGKSTFLRTVGVNLIIAKTGAPVCAKRFVFSLIELNTSIRTNDSIQKSESYFYAELKRLKGIIDKLNNNEKLFVIVDEMLRGTNSKDKHFGSAAFIEQLISKPLIGMLATHDIELGKLIDTYPNSIQNKCFEVDIHDNKLHFDYKLKDGISKNLNATFLMKQMKIIS